MKNEGKDGIWWNVKKITPNSTSFVHNNGITTNFLINSIPKLENFAKFEPEEYNNNNNDDDDEIVLNPEWVERFDRMLKDYEKKKRKRNTRSKNQRNKRPKR